MGFTDPHPESMRGKAKAMDPGTSETIRLPSDVRRKLDLLGSFADEVRLNKLSTPNDTRNAELLKWLIGDYTRLRVSEILKENAEKEIRKTTTSKLTTCAYCYTLTRGRCSACDDPLCENHIFTAGRCKACE